MIARDLVDQVSVSDEEKKMVDFDKIADESQEIGVEAYDGIVPGKQEVLP
jgi:hypothetical protein